MSTEPIAFIFLLCKQQIALPGPLSDVRTKEEGKIVGVLSELYGQIQNRVMFLTHLHMFRGLALEPGLEKAPSTYLQADQMRWKRSLLTRPAPCLLRQGGWPIGHIRDGVRASVKQEGTPGITGGGRVCSSKWSGVPYMELQGRDLASIASSVPPSPKSASRAAWLSS